MRKYFIYDGQFKKGPFTLEELKTASIKKETPVWYEDLRDWTKAGELQELNEIFIQKIVPPPLPRVFKIDAKERDKILSTFDTADEIYPEEKKRSWAVPVIITLLVIVAVIAGLFFYKKYF